MAKSATLKDSLKKLKDKFALSADEPMSRHTSIKIGGAADLFAMPENEEELISIVKTALKENIEITIIGDGTNLLVKDMGIRGLVISTAKFKNEIQTEKSDNNGTALTVSAGTRLSALCNHALKNSLTGIEFAAGIPGTVGGAIAMNAGTPAGSMSDIVTSIKTITDQGRIITIPGKDLNFSYRALANLNGIIIEASLTLKKGGKKEITELHNRNLKAKKTSQPLAAKSAGCFFKNPPDNEPAGKLIDMAGMKGMRIGDAAISETHANFIINLGNAKCEDILKLKQEVEKKIFDLYSVKLHSEIIIKGEQ